MRFSINVAVLLSIFACGLVVTADVRAQESSDEVEQIIEDWLQDLPPEFQQMLERMRGMELEQRNGNDEDRRQRRREILDRIRQAQGAGSGFSEEVPDGAVRDKNDPANSFFRDLRNAQRREESFRTRPMISIEKQTPEELSKFTSLTEAAAGSVVAFKNGLLWLAQGTVIDDQGLVLTKATEVTRKEDGKFVLLNEVECHSGKGKATTSIELLNVNQEHDVALLRVKLDGLEPIEWSDDATDLASFVVSPSHEGKPLSFGVVSVLARSLRGTNTAFLGVGPQPAPGGVGVLVAEVSPRGSAEEAGLLEGDVILQFGEEKISSVTGLVNSIRKNRPGDSVKVRFLREGTEKDATVVLAARNMTGARAARFIQMNSAGAEPSKRNSEFPRVLQHDSPLWPEHCGGPLLDLDGNAIGLNIARGGRVQSYSIPADTVKQLIRELLPN